jgi:hypothetical protein
MRHEMKKMTTIKTIENMATVSTIQARNGPGG